VPLNSYINLTLSQIEDVQTKLEFKKKDIDKLLEKEKTLHANFVTSLGDNNKFAEYLMKVFKKRIKRSKKKSDDNEGDLTIKTIKVNFQIRLFSWF